MYLIIHWYAGTHLESDIKAHFHMQIEKRKDNWSNFSYTWKSQHCVTWWSIWQWQATWHMYTQSQYIHLKSLSKPVSDWKIEIKDANIIHIIVWPLTHLPLVPHICFSESGQHWFRWWLVVYSVPSHYLNQCWVIVNCTIGNKIQWNFNQNTKLFIHENASENIVCEMAAILSRGW